MDTVSGKLPTPEVYVLEIASERIPALGGHLDKIRAVSLPPPPTNFRNNPVTCYIPDHQNDYHLLLRHRGEKSQSTYSYSHRIGSAKATQEREKVFANQGSDKRLLSRLYRELL